MRNVEIGHWNDSSNHYPHLPMPIENSASPARRRELIDELTLIERFCRGSGHLGKIHGSALYCKGWSNCRICKKMNGSEVFQIQYKNTKYHIPEGLIHYVKDHSVDVELDLNGFGLVISMLTEGVNYDF